MEARKGIRANSLSLKSFSVDGRLLERWFLKTLINIAWNGVRVIGPGEHDAGTPSLDLVEAAFGRRDLPEPSGLYLSATVGEDMVLEDRVRIIPKAEGNNLVAAEFLFRGCKFFLCLLPVRFERDGRSHLLYRNSVVKFRVYNYRHRFLVSHQIAFKWS
jgi:hypothetical protein